MNPIRFRSDHSHMALILGAAALLLLPLVLLTGAGRPEAAADYNYVGVAGCRPCHQSPTKGNQFGKWSESAHAKAYTVLGEAKAKEIASAKGIADPQKADACLKCHVTASTLPAARKAPTYKVEDGVGCESCHGPGSAYRVITIMQDLAQAKANGLMSPDEKTCTGCHNPESPTYKPFNYQEALAKIAHPDPTKK
jgi:hypothetical protein